MTNEVNELAPGDIAHPGAASAPAAPLQSTTYEPQAVQATPEQSAAIAHLTTLRAEAAKLGEGKERDALFTRIGQLAQHAVNNGPKPAWYLPEAPKAPDLSAQLTESDDGLTAALAPLGQTLTQEEKAALVSHSTIVGVPQDQAILIGDFAVAAELDAVSARSLATRVAEVGWNAELTDAQREELTERAYKAFGSPEKAYEHGALALAYLESKGLTQWAQQYGGSVGFDPHVILALAGKARFAGLKAKGSK